MYDMVQIPLNKIPYLSSICLYCFYILYLEMIFDAILVSSFFGHFIFVLADLVH